MYVLYFLCLLITRQKTSKPQSRTKSRHPNPAIKFLRASVRTMKLLDFLFIATLFVSIGIGAWRGWMPQALTLTALVCTLIATIKLGPVIAGKLPLSGPGEALRADLGAALALVSTLYLGHKLVQLHRHVFPRQGPQPAHRTLGAFFGVASGAVLLLAFAVVIDATELRNQPWWQESTQERAARTVIEGVKGALSS
jgi:hypothetical protein